MARSSYFTVGGPDDDVNRKVWEPNINKDPFYRTMDILNGVFKKNIKMVSGASNCTDLHTIYINFGELKPSKISRVLRAGRDDDHLIFLLECGHEWEGKKLLGKDGAPKGIGDWGMCGTCGADTIYRGFEHEWQHIIFKSDLAARTVFCTQYSEQLRKQMSSPAIAGEIDEAELSGFLHMLVNAFDDIRVNSLWEKVYPGSAMAIWERWSFYAALMNNKNTSFLAYIFAVAFNIPTNPQGEFEPMRPVIKWALDQVRYRGFNNMLLIVRVVMDRCMGAILAKIKPNPKTSVQPPPPPSLKLPLPTPPITSDEQGNDDEKEDTENASLDDDSQEGENKIGGGQESQCNPQTQTDSSKDQESKTNNSGQTTEQSTGQSDDRGRGFGQSGQQLGIPSSKDIQADNTERAQALARLMEDPQRLDPKEEHSPPTPEDLVAAQKSQSLRAALNRIFHQDISDLDNLHVEQSGEPDSEMQDQLDQLQSGIAQKSESSQLTDGSRAKVTIINVTNNGVGKERIQLESSEKTIIQRLRAAFLRSMGKQKSKRSSVGTSVDIEALIQYLGDYQDPDIFENEDVNQGFAYSVVCDMSGSMNRSFPVVCRATEMLKQALDFPFVVGNLWGFRGGQPITHISSKKDFFGGGEVWMYKYSKEVDWYTGVVPVRLFQGPNGVFQVPVECGGITPMNSAINIATSHLWRKMPAGMAKRMFLLTDGSPLQVKMNGKHISEAVLRQFVAKEINRARNHGIEVYTLIIGEHAIDDNKCLQMFGQRKFWTRVGKERVGTVLLSLVLRNFTKYLRRR